MGIIKSTSSGKAYPEEEARGTQIHQRLCPISSSLLVPDPFLTRAKEVRNCLRDNGVAICSEAGGLKRRAQRPDVCVNQVSEEFLRSCTDEILSSGFISFSGELQSCSHTSDSPLETETSTTSLEDQDEQSEVSVLQKDENKLSEMGINDLKSKETHSERYQSDHRLLPEIPKESTEQLNALLSFCTKKVNLIHQREDSRAKKNKRSKRLQFR